MAGPRRGARGRSARRRPAYRARPAESNRYGAALASGDFDGDGEADLALGVPGLDLVTVLYGPPDDSEPRRLLIQGDALPSPPETEDFGFALLAADFDRDGFDDLVTGAPGNAQQRKDYVVGTAHLIPGARGGLDVRGAAALPGPPGAAGFGSSLGAGDLDRDRDLDLVTGARDEPDINIHGFLAFCPGPPPLECRASPPRPTTPRPPRWPSPTSTTTATRTSCRATRAPEDGNEDFPNAAGEVRLWLGGKNGLDEERLVRARQGMSGIPGNPQGGDRFGHAVEAGDVDGDRVADIVVAAPGAGGQGSVTVIRGARALRARASAYALPVDDVEGNLGGSLSLLDLDGDGLDDLVVARENAPSGDEALVAYMREGNQFGPSVPLTDLDALADVEDSPLRIGR